MDVDGENLRRVSTGTGRTTCGYFLPSGDRITFSSNLHGGGPRDFDLYLIGLDGSGLERVTRSPGFDSFPMFSPDGRYPDGRYPEGRYLEGRYLVWGSHLGSAGASRTSSSRSGLTGTDGRA